MMLFGILRHSELYLNKSYVKTWISFPVAYPACRPPGPACRPRGGAARETSPPPSLYTAPLDSWTLRVLCINMFQFLNMKSNAM